MLNKDRAKWRDFPENLIKIRQKQIDLIKKNVYNIDMLQELGREV